MICLLRRLHKEWNAFDFDAETKWSSSAVPEIITGSSRVHTSIPGKSMRRLGGAISPPFLSISPFFDSIQIKPGL